MTQKNLIFYAMTVLFLSGLSIASAQEVRIQKSDLPPVVQKTADEQSKGATVRGYTMETEGGQLEYEVEMTVNGHSKDVSIDAKGNILEIEEEIALDKLPVAVREGLQKKTGAGAIKKVESITKHGTVVAYEANVITNGKKSEVQVGPGGKPLDHEE